MPVLLYAPSRASSSAVVQRLSLHNVVKVRVINISFFIDSLLVAAIV